MTAKKNEKFPMKNVIFLLFLLVELEAVLTGTHNLRFIAEIRKVMYTSANLIFIF